MATLSQSPVRRQRTRSIIAAATCCASISTLSTVIPHAQAQPVGSSQVPTNPSDSDIAAAQQAITTSSESVSQLAGELSNAQSAIAQLENEMGGLREAVNKALVDLQRSQSEADQARKAVDSAKGELDNSQTDIEKAQQSLDEISRSAYRHGSGNKAVSGAAGTGQTEDALARQSYLRLNAQKQRAAIEELDRLRTEAANKESELREARGVAEQRETEAKNAEGEARAAIDSNSAQLRERSAQHADLKNQQALAQARLDAAKNNSGQLQQQRKEFEDFQRAEEARKEAERQAAAAAAAQAKAEAEAKARAEAKAEADRQAAAAAAAAERAEKQRAAEQAAAQAKAAQEKAEAEAASAAQREQARKEAAAAASAAAVALAAANATQEPAATTVTPTATTPSATAPSVTGTATATGTTTASPSTAPGRSSGVFSDTDYLKLETLNEVNKAAEKSVEVVQGARSEVIEAVIARAQSQVGVPYAWGGGNAAGPTLGIRDGGVADSYGDYNKVGFDCSGLVVYAFAAAGLSLPHYTGYQYQQGKKIDPSQMQRGDLIFYGPNAEHHVAIYLGNGMMLEAPQSGSTVSVNPVRYSGMSPYAVRLV